MELADFQIESSSTLLEAAEAIIGNRSRCVVVTADGKVIAILSEGDIMRALLRGSDILSPLLPFVRHGIYFLTERDMERALQLVQQHGISLIPILDDDLSLTGVVTLQDLLGQIRIVDPEEE